MRVKVYKHQAQRRQKRVRTQLFGKTDRPRLSVFRSNKSISAQLIDDQKRITLVAASEKDIKAPAKATKTDKAALVGQTLATKALKKKIKQVKFDRGSYKFHGRVKALAEAARQAGLEF